MIPRILMVVVMGAICVAPLSAAGTRIFVTGGTGWVDVYRSNESVIEGMPRLEVVADAPPFLRKRVALEFALGFAGPFSSTPLPPEVLYDASTTTAWRSWYYLWDTRSHVSESVRIYWQGRRKPDGRPDGIEVGIGGGNYQNIGRWILVAEDEQSRRLRIPENRYYVQSGWCAEAFLRLVILPSLSYGPIFTAGAQTSFGKIRNESILSLALGWRFHV